MSRDEIKEIKDELKYLRRRVEWLTIALVALALGGGGLEVWKTSLGL